MQDRQYRETLIEGLYRRLARAARRPRECREFLISELTDRLCDGASVV